MKRLRLAWAFLAASCVPTVVYSQDYSPEACWELAGQECGVSLQAEPTLELACWAPGDTGTSEEGDACQEEVLVTASLTLVCW